MNVARIQNPGETVRLPHGLGRHTRVFSGVGDEGLNESDSGLLFALTHALLSLQIVGDEFSYDAGGFFEFRRL